MSVVKKNETNVRFGKFYEKLLLKKDLIMQSPKSGQILWHIREKEDAFIEIWSNSLAYQRTGGCIH